MSTMSVEELRTEMHDALATIRPAVIAEVDAVKAELEEAIIGLQAQIENISSTLDTLVKSIANMEQRLH